jgi:hypothetical protein
MLNQQLVHMEVSSILGSRPESSSKQVSNVFIEEKRRVSKCIPLESVGVGGQGRRQGKQGTKEKSTNGGFVCLLLLPLSLGKKIEAD